MTSTVQGVDRAHDPGPAEARRRAELAQRVGSTRLHVGRSEVLIGTAGWTDPTLLPPGVFYPEGTASAEARLRHYASRFPMVEVDSTYYALPARRMAELWVERTPPDFVFDIKAFALMTGHATETSRLPASFRLALPHAVSDVRRLYAKDLPPELRDEVWRIFADAVAPLADAGKLGAILLQYPRWVRPAAHAADMLERARDASHLHARHGWELAGAFTTAMNNDDEALLLWAVPTWQQWAEAETDGDLAKWRRGLNPRTWHRVLLVDAPLCPFRTGRQPTRADRVDWQD